VNTTSLSSTTNHKVIYGVVGGVLAVLLIIMLVTWNYNRPSESAVAKAEQLVSAFQAAGLQTPVDVDQVAQAFGEDGGEVCQLAGSGALLGYLKTRLGVGGEFYYRPTLVDRRVVLGTTLVVKTYCPQKLAAAEAFVAGLRYAS
jgi:hypothetical protein